MPFNPNSIRFIKKCYADGKIEIVLFWEDAGYGAIIQTTGTNLLETEAISKLLEKEYSK